MNTPRILLAIPAATAEMMGILAVLIMLVAYGIQISDTLDPKSKCAPNPIAWLGFGFLTGIGFLVQWHAHAGPGSWVMGLTAIFCLLVAAASQRKKHWKWSDFDRKDWGIFALGVVLFAFYLISKNLSWGPIVSAILATLADVVLYIPIFRNTWEHPEEENATGYGLNSLKFVPSIFAMNVFSIETCLYPSAMIAANGLVVFYLLWRRRVLLTR